MSEAEEGRFGPQSAQHAAGRVSVKKSEFMGKRDPSEQADDVPDTIPTTKMKMVELTPQPIPRLPSNPRVNL